VIAALPLSLALGFAILSFFTRYRAPYLSVAGSFVLFLVNTWILISCARGEIFSLQAGGWEAPYGISFHLDLLGALMVWISSFLILGVHIYTLSTLSSVESEKTKGFHSVWHLLAAGVYGSFSTADLFNLFVWFEVLLLASFVLMGMGGKPWRLKANLYYVLINLSGSAVFLLGLGFLYNGTGTLNFEDLKQVESAGFARDVATLALLIAFGMKAAIFPLYSWLPASYPSTPIGPLSLFAGLLTKVGVYTILRFLGTPSILQTPWLSSILFPLACLTMVLGVYGAASQMTMRKILSFHIISQIGYMILGIAVGEVLGLAAAIFYLMHHMVVKTNLFLVAGVVETIYGTSDLKRIGGVGRRHPWLAGCFAISALSLAGIPPLSGFWAKLFTLYGAAASEAYFSLALGMFVGLLTLFSMMKIWNEGFLKEIENVQEATGIPLSMMIPIVVFSFWTISLGLYPGWLLSLSETAALELLGGVR